MKKAWIFIALISIVSCKKDDPVFNNNIDDVEFQTNDILNFWAAVDSYETGTPVGSHFQDNYINKGSDVLKETFQKEGVIGNDFNVVFGDYKNFYSAIRELTILRSTEKRSAIVAAFERLQSLYPKASFTDVYFAIGRFNNGGRRVDSGVYVGMEFFAKADEIPVEELTDWEQDNIRTSEGLEMIVCRETIHTLQNYGDKNSILGASIFEGAADFLAELMTEQRVAVERYEFGDANTADIWTNFKIAISSEDPISDWVYQESQNNPYGYPPNMGYYMGYQIVKAFYDSKTDKAEAIEAILNIQDFDRFLQESGYQG